MNVSAYKKALTFMRCAYIVIFSSLESCGWRRKRILRVERPFSLVPPHIYCRWRRLRIHQSAKLKSPAAACSSAYF